MIYNAALVVFKLSLLSVPFYAQYWLEMLGGFRIIPKGLALTGGPKEHFLAGSYFELCPFYQTLQRWRHLWDCLLNLRDRRFARKPSLFSERLLFTCSLMWFPLNKGSLTIAFQSEAHLNRHVQLCLCPLAIRSERIVVRSLKTMTVEQKMLAFIYWFVPELLLENENILLCQFSIFFPKIHCNEVRGHTARLHKGLFLHVSERLGFAKALGWILNSCGTNIQFVSVVFVLRSAVHSNHLASNLTASVAKLP